MKKIVCTLAVAASLMGCGPQGGQQETSSVSQTAHTVVKNFDMRLSNGDNEQEGRCGDQFQLSVSRVSDAMIQNFVVSVTVDGRQYATLQPGDSILNIDTRDFRCGVLPVSVKISADSLQDEYVTKYITLYSDIVPTTKGYKIIKAYNHDANAYTQGLVVEDGCFYESTGLNRKSSLRKVGIERGDVIQSVPLADEYFGEGLALVGDRLIQLTWQNHKAFVYDKKTFQMLQEFYLPTEGWGLTCIAPDTLLLTDGTPNIHFVDPNSFSTMRTIQVYDNAGPVEYLNETELYNGHILANIYRSNMVAEIDYHTGKVVSYIDLTGLLPANLYTEHTDVLNGIAYDAEHDALYVTGKNWPKLYMIKIEKK